MRFWKSLALSLLGFLLFLSLSGFGLALTANTTLLSPRFVKNEINRLDLASLAKESLDQQSGLSDEIKQSLESNVNLIQPLVKQQAGKGIDSFYAYLLGQNSTLDIASTLNGLITDPQFLNGLVDRSDIATLSIALFDQQYGPFISSAVRPYVAPALKAAESQIKVWLKQQLNIAAPQIADYLLGKSNTLNAVIQTSQLKSILRQSFLDSFLKSVPPQLAGITSVDTLTRFFDTIYQPFANQIPPLYNITPDTLGVAPATPALMAQAQEGLTKAKGYVGFVRLLFVLLIAAILILVILIILVHGQYKGAARDLGIISLTYGAFELAGVLVLRYIAIPSMVQTQIPAALQTWLPQFLNGILQPLFVFSLVMLVIGIVLIVISLAYRPGIPTTRT
jgi:hypothetical protein